MVNLQYQENQGANKK